MLAFALVLSVLIGISLGLLGGGGSILTLPILMYALHMGEKEAIATSLLVVGATSAAAVLTHARAGRVRWKIGLIFAAAGATGAFGGGVLADYIPATWLIRAFILMMLATAFAMFRGRKEIEAKQGPLPVFKVALDGLAVGVVTGLVGAGGGFLVVPALVLLGGLPMYEAVGTSLLVIAVKSFAGFAGHATHVQIDYKTAGMVVVAAIVGSVIGGKLAPMVPQNTLRKGFAIFVLLMAIFMAWKQLA